MKPLIGKEGRSHFRLDVENKSISVNVIIDGKVNLKGLLRDVSNGGISFTLDNPPNFELINQIVHVVFDIEDKTFVFDLRILRIFKDKKVACYAGQFVESPKIKKSQLSLLLMKLKLIQ